MNRAYAKTYEHLYQHHWWWRTRENLIIREIQSALNDHPNAPLKLMDVGCGNGLLFPKLEAYGEVCGIEIDESLIDPDGHYATQIYSAPLNDSNYSESHYDIVTALDVMEHIQDDCLFARNLVRILKPGGTLILTVPAFQSLWDQHDVDNQHWRRYNKRQIIQHFEGLGSLISCRYLFSCLYPPKYLIARLNQGRNTKISQTRIPNRWINAFMIRALLLEDQCQRRLQLPFGTSLLLVLRKPLKTPD